MDISMSERKKYLEMKIMFTLLNYSLESATYSSNLYYYYDFIQEINEVFSESKLLYILPKDLLGEIKMYTYRVHFVVAKSYLANDCQRMCKEIRERIRRVENANEMMKSTIIRRIIKEEKEVRNIPKGISLEPEDILELYRLDFKNKTSITSPTSIASLNSYTKQELFSFLATVNKLYKECPSDISEREEFIKQIIKEIEYCNPKFSSIIEEYQENTIGILCKNQKDREEKHKIIDFKRYYKK